MYFEHKNVTVFEGNYDAYKAFYANEAIKKNDELKNNTSKPKQISKKDIPTIEKEIIKIEQSIETKKELTFDPEYYLDKEKIEGLNEEIENLEKQLTKLDEEYYKLLEMS